MLFSIFLLLCSEKLLGYIVTGLREVDVEVTTLQNSCKEARYCVRTARSHVDAVKGGIAHSLR